MFECKRSLESIFQSFIFLYSIESKMGVGHMYLINIHKQEKHTLDRSILSFYHRRPGIELRSSGIVACTSPSWVTYLTRPPYW